MGQRNEWWYTPKGAGLWVDDSLRSIADIEEILRNWWAFASVYCMYGILAQWKTVCRLTMLYQVHI